MPLLFRTPALALFLAFALASPGLAQSPAPPRATPATQTAPAQLTLEKLFASAEFSGQGFQGGRWAAEGPVLRFVDRDRTSGATSLVELNLQTNARRTLIDGSALPAPGGEGLFQIEDYAYAADGSRALLYTDSEQVWRLNTKGYYYVYDLAGGGLTPVSPRERGFQMFAKFDPAARRVAFVRDRNLYVADLASGQERALTTDGAEGTVINGTFDWVYEEEFGLRDGFRWSPDGRNIAFFQLDESATRDFQMTDFRTLYPETTQFRYPKAGEDNSQIRIGLVEPETGRTRFFETGTWNQPGNDVEYIAGMGWTPPLADGRSHVWMIRLNRNQNHMDLLYGDPQTMEVRTVLSETNDTYIEVEDGFSDTSTGTVTYLQDGRHFVLRSNRDGFAHLYLYRNDGTPVGQITRGAWDVSTFHGVDEATGFVYVTTTAVSPMERHLYRVPLPAAVQSAAARGTQRGRSAEPERLTREAGWHGVQLSADYSHFLSSFSTTDAPPTVALYTTTGQAPGALVTTLVDNAALRERLALYNLPPAEFMTVPAADGTPLHAYLVKPRDFNPNRQYPLLIHTYGGPGSQVVRNRWEGNQRLWHHFLADTYGVLVAGVDNRGSGGRGWAFKSATQNRLGILEAEDQIAAAQHFGAMPFVDADRVGIWGWSYGGYLSLLAALYEDGPETFKVAMAVAPVTNWRQYDTIYTERYLSTPQLNAEGYDLGSPVTYAANLRDSQRVLIVHGDADDNVHVQNAIIMADAFQAANKQFDMMIYPGRNHGIAGGRTRLHLYTLMTRYVAEHLAGATFSASN